MHTRTDPDAVIPALCGAIAGVDRGLPISNIATLDGAVDESMSARRFTMMLLAAFAVLAVVLALAGVYGVLAYAVAGRTSEIGVRLALGAGPRRVLGLVVLQGMRPSPRFASSSAFVRLLFECVHIVTLVSRTRASMASAPEQSGCEQTAIGRFSLTVSDSGNRLLGGSGRGCLNPYTGTGVRK